MLAISKEYYEAGFADGKEEGKEEERLLFVRKLLELNVLSDEEIAEAYDIDLSKIKEIKETLI